MTAPVVPLLTGTQRRIVDTIRAYADAHGFAATVREIGVAVHLSPSAVAYQIGRLHEAGWIRRVPGSARALSVLNPATGGE